MFEELSINDYLDRIVDNDNYTDNRNSEQDVVVYLELCQNKKYNYPQISENDFFEYIYPKLNLYKDKYKVEIKNYLDRLNNITIESLN